jgi:SPP1 gp7 family putative phage head morphogenesis protein
MSTEAEIAETRRHQRLLERARERDEPTRVRSLRRRYAQRLRGALQGIRAALRRGLVENDALGIEALADTPRRGQFDFNTDAQKANAFTEWIDTQTRNDILERFGSENQYIKEVYERGVEDAHNELRTLEISEGRGTTGVALRLPIHQEQLRSLYARNLNELEGMTNQLGTDLRRGLTEGVAAGENPRTIADDLTEVVGRVEDGSPMGAMNRATRIARTEVMNSMNAARATEWERAGVQKVGLLLANTACPQCQALKAGEPYDISEARSLVPARSHPNCRCSTHVWTGKT